MFFAAKTLEAAQNKISATAIVIIVVILVDNQSGSSFKNGALTEKKIKKIT